MYGVAALLDQTHHNLVESLWKEFREQFGIKGIASTPIPHFSFHVADRYNFVKLRDVLEEAARHDKPFTVRTNGLGIFTGAVPVLYVPVIRSPALTTFHTHIWDLVSATGTNVSPYYHPNNWRPHITLAHRDVDHNLLPRVVRLLSERTFSWEIRIEKLAVLSSNNEPEQTVMMTMELGADDPDGIAM